MDDRDPGGEHEDDPAAGRQRNRELWTIVSEQFGHEDAATKWSEPSIGWGLFARPEAELGVLGDVRGQDVLELGCGSAYFSSWLCRLGARTVAVDLSRPQLETARACQASFDVTFPLLEGDGERVPLRSGSFDLVVSEYGAGPWCHPARWLPEAARVLRAHGRLVFLTNSVLAALCVPAEGGTAGVELLRPQRDLYPVAWPGGGVEHHASHADWIRELTSAGFVVDGLHELYAPADATPREHYEIVTTEWAMQWPAEDLWVAHLA